MLISLIAPRPVYVSSATQDEWADPASEFMSLIYAAPVYRLFGYKALGTEQFPQPDTPIYGEKMGYHIRTGVHDLIEYDWNNFMEFTDRYLKDGNVS